MKVYDILRKLEDAHVRLKEQDDEILSLRRELN